MNRLIDDFTDAPEDRWRLVTDQVMGGVSEGRARFGRDPAHVHLTGTVSTANNGGFIQVRRDLEPWPARTEAVLLTVKGDGQTYFMALRTQDATRPWQSWRAAFAAPTDWQELRLPIADFAASRDGMPPLDLTRLRAIGLLAYGRDHAADLRIARIAID